MVVKKWSAGNVRVENAPFRIDIKGYKGKHQICTAPWRYIEDLPSHILSNITSLNQ